ncbi:MAG: sugar transferase [Candidatus Pacebacteria bacterium]|jgi:lipopolysaccharide/colanic/teichoic acid biosynthesis glycosyltransferase|nr:sugar transferase [Candidatus Paceibacterota bacterium]
MIKRLIDILGSGLGLAILSPVFLFVAAKIKANDRGPVFYMGERVGKNGKPFKMLKFRTMVVDADKMGGPSTSSDDPRLTRIGNFLKKYQLDELPQLINVLKGQMSLVGPRPEVKMYVDMMTPEEKDVILSVRPGMTDYASLWNFHEGEALKGAKDPEEAYQRLIRPQKLELQKKYVKEKSLFTDIKIIFLTIAKVFK